MRDKLNAYRSRQAEKRNGLTPADEKYDTCLHGFYYRELCPICGPRKETLEKLKQIEKEKFGEQ